MFKRLETRNVCVCVCLDLPGFKELLTLVGMERPDDVNVDERLWFTPLLISSRLVGSELLLVFVKAVGVVTGR